MSLNKEIADFFISDCKEYLKRYEVLQTNSTHIGNRSKLLVDLIFSLECLLKSIIFIESNNTEKETYNKIKTHDFKKLSKSLSSNSKEKFKECIKYDLTHYQVGIRYQIESEIDFRNECGVLDKRYYDTIANPSWLKSVYEQIKSLLDYAEQLNPVELTVTNFCDISYDAELQKFNTLKNIRTK